MSLLGDLYHKFNQFLRANKYKNHLSFPLGADHLTTMELLELIKEKSDINCIYDIGANIGTWSILAKALFPRAAIFAFEPIPAVFRTLNSNCANLKEFQSFNLGCGSTSGPINIYEYPTSDISSVLPILKGADFFNVVGDQSPIVKKIELIRIDDFINAQKAMQPDLIKLDIQGYELEALKGALNTLIKTKYIICEVSFKEIYKDQPLFDKIVGFLSPLGFYPTAFSVDTKLGQRLNQTDVLFERIHE